MVAVELTRSVKAVQILECLPQKRLVSCRAGTVVFRIGEPADSVYYVQSGRVKISRLSQRGREAIIGLLGEGEFVGEGCLIGQQQRRADAICIENSLLIRINKNALLVLLRTNSSFAEDFMAYLLSRNTRYQDDLEDQLNNSTEKRVARALLLLAHLGGSGELVKTVPYVSPATIAQLVGTTRARVSQLMNCFRERGLIDYDRHELTVRSLLVNILLR